MSDIDIGYQGPVAPSHRLRGKEVGETTGIKNVVEYGMPYAYDTIVLATRIAVTPTPQALPVAVTHWVLLLCDLGNGPPIWLGKDNTVAPGAGVALRPGVPLVLPLLSPSLCWVVVDTGETANLDILGLA
jgi:hypothetical protein